MLLWLDVVPVAGVGAWQAAQRHQPRHETPGGVVSLAETSWFT